ncbi:MAG: hypothetical protein NT037_13340 [Hyphomicrobiales bacterium]|jgi:hypothetical protein|nr:hypothetical protein [Hyphomicrobiales bacterium]
MRSGLHTLLGFVRDERGTMVAGVAKAALAICCLSVIAANIMSNRIDAREKQVLAALTGSVADGRNIDTAATGSLARQVDAIKLDPCTLPPRR